MRAAAALRCWWLLLATICLPSDAPVAAAREVRQEEAPRVGVLVQGPAVKGLFRDAECLVWALARDPVRLNGRAPSALSVFYTSNYAILDSVVGAGMQCVEDRTRGKFCATADALGPGDSARGGALGGKVGVEQIAPIARMGKPDCIGKVEVRHVSLCLFG